jgi:shikimate kinase
MKLIVVYGPPAAGKLTVSEELASRTGFEVFHNHVTFDIYRQVTKERNQDFWDKVTALRLELIELAAQNGIDLIFTLCYEPTDFAFIEKIIRAVELYKGEVFFVQLKPSEKELLKRVGAESRNRYRKLKDPVELKRALTEDDYFTQIEARNSIVIDNSEISAEKVAEQVIEEFEL